MRVVRSLRVALMHARLAGREPVARPAGLARARPLSNTPWRAPMHCTTAAVTRHRCSCEPAGVRYFSADRGDSGDDRDSSVSASRSPVPKAGDDTTTDGGGSAITSPAAGSSGTVVGATDLTGARTEATAAGRGSTVSSGGRVKRPAEHRVPFRSRRNTPVDITSPAALQRYFEFPFPQELRRLFANAAAQCQPGRINTTGAELQRMSFLAAICRDNPEVRRCAVAVSVCGCVAGAALRCVHRDADGWWTLRSWRIPSVPMHKSPPWLHATQSAALSPHTSLRLPCACWFKPARPHACRCWTRSWQRCMRR